MLTKAIPAQMSYPLNLTMKTPASDQDANHATVITAPGFNNCPLPSLSNQQQLHRHFVIDRHYYPGGWDWDLKLIPGENGAA